MLLTAALFSIAPVVPADANPIDDLKGFYVADPSDCLYADGTLYLCKDGNCISQDYNQGASTSPEFLKGSATEITSDGMDEHGFSVAAGDIALSFSNTVRVVRPNGDQLLTTNAGRKVGGTTISFIRDGVAVDPSAKAQDLRQCPAYAEAAQRWLANGRAPQRIEPQASVYFNPLQKPYSWMYRTVLFNTDEGVDVIAKSESRFDVPSYVFGNNGDNTFSVAEKRIGTNAITNAATFGGDDMLIEMGADNRSIYLTGYPH